MRRPRRALELLEQRQVALAAQRRDRAGVGGTAILLDELDQPVGSRAVVPLETGRLGAEVLEEHIGVAQRAELAGEPLELVAKRLAPLGLDHVGRSAEHRAQAPRRNAHVVHRLWIDGEAHTRVVANDGLVLGADLEEQVLDRRCVAGGPFLGDARHAAERTLELHLGAAVARARVVEAALEGVEQRVVADDQLDLELLERVHLVRALEDHHLVGRHLGLTVAVADAHALTPRAHRRRRPELAAAEVRGQELVDLDRRQRAAVGLDLQPAILLRQPELPLRPAVLDPAAQRDPAAKHAPVGRVEVGRGEHTTLYRLSVELGEQLRAAKELPFALELGAGGHSRIVRGVLRDPVAGIHQTET